MFWIDKKYLKLVSSRFRNSKWKNEDLLNHSCPYCGDSEKNQYKARGYHFKLKETFIYKCHNCGVAKPFAKFIADDHKKHFVVHPAAAAYRGGKWDSDNLFKKINENLKERGEKEIQW